MQITSEEMQMPPSRLVLLGICFSYVMGCIMAPYLQMGPWIWGIFAGSILLGIVLHKMSLTSVVAVGLCFFTLGVVLMQAKWDVSPPVEGKYQITAYVYGEPSINSSGNLAVELGEVTLDGVPYSGKAYCSIYLYENSDLALFDGAFVSMQGRVYEPDGKSGAPHGDFQMWMRQNEYAYGIAVSQEVYVQGDAQTAPWKDVASRMRGICKTWLESSMQEQSRVAMALLFGQKEGFTAEEVKAVQELGVAHVFAVSGLHVGMLSGILIWILIKCRMSPIPRWWITAVFLLLYCFVCQGRSSCVRAAVMVLFLQLGENKGMMVDPLFSLSFALMVVLMIDPMQLYSHGLLLSFCAVGGLMLFYPPMIDQMYRWFPMGPRPLYARRPTWMKITDWLKLRLGGVRELLCISVAANLGVFMPSVMIFHQLPTYGIFVNLWLVPYVTVLMPLYILVLLLGRMPLLGSFISALAVGMTDFMMNAVMTLSQLPYAFVRVSSIEPPFIVLGIACMIVLGRRFNASVFVRFGLIGIFSVIAIVCYLAMPKEGVRYIQLAVGQADAALLMEKDATVAIDVGDDGSAVLDYLLDEGKSLDAVIITHMHNDHMGGLSTLLEAKIDIGCVYLPPKATELHVDESCLQLLERLVEAEIPIQTLAAGDELRYNETVITVTWPVAEHVRVGSDANNYGLALAIDFHGYSLLSMADIGTAYENYAARPCDVLKVGHHGSADASSEAFLAFTKPSIGLVSCSSGSAYHPSESTIHRLQEAGVEIHRTDERGDITLTVKEGALWVIPYKGVETSNESSTIFYASEK